MAVDAYLELDGIKGESQDSKNKDQIEVLSYTFGAHQSGTSTQGGGSGAGRVSFSDLAITKNIDKSSPVLMENCATGKHIKNGKLHVRKAGGDQQEYMTVILTDLIVSSYQTSGHGNGGDVPSDSVTLNFSKIEFDYKPQKADGTLDGVVKGGWDVKANKKA